MSIMGMFACGLLLLSVQDAYDAPPIRYAGSRPRDRVAALSERLADGSVKLAYEEPQGFLKAFLAALDVPVSSQGLVFSKTSFQRRWIHPRAPRAIYFGDDVYVGWVQGGEVLEISAVDPDLGAVFYSLQQDETRPARLVRQLGNCLQCHESTSLTVGVPGHTVRSVHPAGDGRIQLQRPGFHTTHRSPLPQRWGGWYVSGEHGAQRHLGNQVFPDDPRADPAFQAERGANLLDLSRRFDVEPYLAPTSDIVALMVLEYQTHVHILVTRANWEARKSRGTPEAAERVKEAGEALLEALFYAGETVLTDPIRGNSSFVQDFEKRGPFDPDGRSLRQFDLRTRMFKHPLSWLVYTPAFQELPPEALDYQKTRMSEVLDGRGGPAFAHLSEEDRRAVRKILVATLPGFLPEGR
jgi:hypothetical protein